jgi:hypothetical protein
MSKLSDQQKNMLRLYERSRKDAEGWANVSDTVWPLVEQYAIPEMFEIQGRRIRATEAGKAVLMFAI